jgi:hypothetical protein
MPPGLIADSRESEQRVDDGRQPLHRLANHRDLSPRLVIQLGAVVLLEDAGKRIERSNRGNRDSNDLCALMVAMAPPGRCQQRDRAPSDQRSSAVLGRCAEEGPDRNHLTGGKRSAGPARRDPRHISVRRRRRWRRWHCSGGRRRWWRVVRGCRLARQQISAGVHALLVRDVVAVLHAAARHVGLAKADCGAGYRTNRSAGSDRVMPAR